MTSPVAFDAGRALALARDTLIIEAEAVQALTARIDAAFAGALQCLLACRGRVVVMGMGKSGHIGRKLAATLASTGTPSQFVHPAEASHGDLGMITPQDVVLAISNSGESDELTVLLPLIKRMGVPLVAFTGRAESALARHADWVLDTAVAREACPHNLAPTASTTAQLALGDALAVALLDARGFRADDFARSHPGGSLGRRLLTHVSDVMRQGEAVPRVAPATPLMDLIDAGTSALGAWVSTTFPEGPLTSLLADGIIADCAMVPAGAWNFHPDGPFCREAMSGPETGEDLDGARKRLTVLALALDPSIAHTVDVIERAPGTKRA